MDHFSEAIKQCPLFSGIDAADFDKLLACMDAQTASYSKGQIILLSGNPVDAVGLVLRGYVQVLREDKGGHSHILTEISVSDLFGETFACAGIDHSPVTVVAVENCEILFLNYRKTITTCAASCAFHAKLIENMLMLLARKNLFLNQKLEILSKRTTRERLLLFFDQYRGTTQKFLLPYSREELAALLCVDRSALSAELSKMQSAGLIRFHKNEFELL